MGHWAGWCSQLAQVLVAFQPHPPVCLRDQCGGATPCPARAGLPLPSTRSVTPTGLVKIEDPESSFHTHLNLVVLDCPMTWMLRLEVPEYFIGAQGLGAQWVPSLSLLFPFKTTFSS